MKCFITNETIQGIEVSQTSWLTVLFSTENLSDEYCTVVNIYFRLLLVGILWHCQFLSNIFFYLSNRVGLVFCGRQSPGGHNVIWGLHDAIKGHNPNSTFLGFLGKFHCFFASPAIFSSSFFLHEMHG